MTSVNFASFSALFLLFSPCMPPHLCLHPSVSLTIHPFARVSSFSFIPLLSIFPFFNSMIYSSSILSCLPPKHLSFHFIPSILSFHAFFFFYIFIILRFLALFIPPCFLLFPTLLHIFLLFLFFLFHLSLK